MLQIHFRDFPSDTLLSWEGSQPLLQAYLNSLKEAAVICSGNAASILQMSQQSQQNLWQSVETADLASFQRVASSLQLTPKARGSRSASVPVRLLFQRSASGKLQMLIMAMLASKMCMSCLLMCGHRHRTSKMWKLVRSCLFVTTASVTKINVLLSTCCHSQIPLQPKCSVHSVALSSHRKCSHIEWPGGKKLL